MSKAYDRIKWDYLKEILRKMGFCDTWVAWMGMSVAGVMEWV